MSISLRQLGRIAEVEGKGWQKKQKKDNKQKHTLQIIKSKVHAYANCILVCIHLIKNITEGWHNQAGVKH